MDSERAVRDDVGWNLGVIGPDNLDKYRIGRNRAAHIRNVELHFGDDNADMVYFRPSTNEWFILRSNYVTFHSFVYGAKGDVASPGDYDGDGNIDATVFRPSTNRWCSFQSSTSATVITPFGAACDQAVPNAYVR